MPINTDIQLLKRRRCRIVATLGPATSEIKTISQLLTSGVNVFRLNMSHGDHEAHKSLLKNIRSAIRKTGINAAIMADLCGPKIRTGKFENDQVILKRREKVIVTTRSVLGNERLIPSQYKRLHQDVVKGQRILLNDGLLALDVLSVQGSEISCQVVHGGKLSNHKGINLPDSIVSAPALTAKDKKDAAFALEQGVDYLSLSFVRTAKDILQLRRIIQCSGSSTHIIAKIETPQALENITEIMDACDAIMVARGDLGVELKPEEVPVAQLQLIDQARKSNRPVIVATQVLESMIENPRPTRAEISDISYAVSSGADACMLSAETSVGKYPVSAIKTMDRTIRFTESYQWRAGVFGTFGLERENMPPLAFGDAISNATSQLSNDLLVRAIVVISRSGMSAVTVSAARPSAPIIGVTDNVSVASKMELMWGVIPRMCKSVELNDVNRLSRGYALDLKLAKQGDYIIVVQGFHADSALNAPGVSVLKI